MTWGKQVHTKQRGRRAALHMLLIYKRQIKFLLELGFKVSDISSMIGVKKITLASHSVAV